jgi:hypothetical protein
LYFGGIAYGKALPLTQGVMVCGGFCAR